MLVFAAALLAAIGYAVMALWNAVLPAVAGVHAIGFFQAVGLLVLSRILFGGLRARRMRGWHWRGRMQARWRQMSPEERERFRNRMGRGFHCRRSASSAGTSQAQ
jgi:site-specific recombinase